MTLPCGCELGIEEEYNKTDGTFYDLPSIEFCPTMKHAEATREALERAFGKMKKMVYGEIKLENYSTLIEFLQYLKTTLQLTHKQ